MKMKKFFLFMTALFIILTVNSCKKDPETDVPAATTEVTAAETEVNNYTQISAEEAKQVMQEQTDYIILDVRTLEEYESGHIPGALLVPNEVIGVEELTMLPDKDQLILVYCRSGNRSQQASQKLVDLGYTNIYEFGGIIDWPYETE
ncbi:MAG: rhodanese-like domain-containing protein [Eubacteriales bacterium]